MLIVFVYPGFPGPGFTGVEFRCGFSQFDDTTYSIPGERQATFQEELRVTWKAWGYFQDGSDEGDIESKLREAYGTRVKVDVNPLSLASRVG